MQRRPPTSMAARFRLAMAPARTAGAVGADACPPVVYAIGLDALSARALYADLRADIPGLAIRRRRSVPGADAKRSRAIVPECVLLDLNLPNLSAEVDAAQAAWGDRAVVVGVGRDQPFTLIWSGFGRPERVEIGPGFLRPYLRRRTLAAGR